MDLSSLLDLCGLHSTPGDEDEVVSFLLRCWRQHGLVPEVYGRYAVATRISSAPPSAPTVLICAHADSPGYVVQRCLATVRGQWRWRWAGRPGMLTSCRRRKLS